MKPLISFCLALIFLTIAILANSNFSEVYASIAIICFLFANKSYAASNENF